MLGTCAYADNDRATTQNITLKIRGEGGHAFFIHILHYNLSRFVETCILWGLNNSTIYVRTGLLMCDVNAHKLPHTLAPRHCFHVVFSVNASVYLYMNSRCYDNGQCKSRLRLALSNCAFERCPCSRHCEQMPHDVTILHLARDYAHLRGHWRNWWRCNTHNKRQYADHRPMVTVEVLWLFLHNFAIPSRATMWTRLNGWITVL